VGFQEIACGVGVDAHSPICIVVASIRSDPLLVLYDEVNWQGRVADSVIPTDNYDGSAGIVVHQLPCVSEEPPFFQTHGVAVHVRAFFLSLATEG
jgi:hypothetical protein